MPTDEMTVLGSRVRAERMRRDLTQSHLAELAEMDRSALNRIENGERRLTALELSRIAAALGVTMNTFFHDATPSIVSYRNSQADEASRSSIDEHLEQLAADIELIQSLGALPVTTPETTRHPGSRSDAEAMAMEFRRSVGIADTDPFTAIARHAAGVGLLIFSRNLGPDAPDAGTALLRNGGVSVINSDRKIGRRRLAAAHEIGHYLVQDEYTVDWRTTHFTSSGMEGLLDAFARALLLPQNAMRQEWTDAMEGGDLRAASVVMASRFQVDMTTLAQRLTDLELISDDAAAAVRAVRTTQSDLIELDLHVPPEEFAGETQPRAYQQGVLALVRRRSISREKALSLLPSSFELDDLPPPELRSEHELWHFVS